MADLPPDVRQTLSQLLESAGEHARRREAEELAAVLGTVERVTKNKVPEGPLKERLRHGRAAARRRAGDEPLVAAAYLRAMCDRVEAADGE